jgi:hypothetical protein
MDRGGPGNINTQFVNPVWPNGNVGDTQADPQRYGPTTNVGYCGIDPTLAGYPNNPPQLVPAYYYNISGFEVAQVQSGLGQTRQELHYAPFWSYWTVPSTCNPPDTPGSSSDYTGQLGYSDPPESTVVTWDTWFRDYDANGNPLHERQDIVLFLGGDARPYDSANMATVGWMATP